MRGRRTYLEEGMRFGRLTVVLPLEAKALARCDCGVTKAYARCNLANGNSKSCGCWRVDQSREKATRTSKEQTTRGWKEGWWDRDQASKQAQVLIEANRGTPGNGFNAKGPEHHSAKWYAIRAPDGRVIEGLNLNDLIRQNAHMFNPADIAMRKNKWGTDIGNKAMGGLRLLFAANSRVKSWKGWTAVERKEKTEITKER